MSHSESQVCITKPAHAQRTHTLTVSAGFKCLSRVCGDLFRIRGFSLITGLISLFLRPLSFSSLCFTTVNLLKSTSLFAMICLFSFRAFHCTMEALRGILVIYFRAFFNLSSCVTSLTNLFLNPAIFYMPTNITCSS